MPLKNKNSNKKKIIFWILVAALAVLMIMYFPPAQNVTEVVLYPK